MTFLQPLKQGALGKKLPRFLQTVFSLGQAATMFKSELFFKPR